jgi:hypothetical protein
MDGKKSKFDYEIFHDETETVLCINADKYTLEEAYEIAKKEDYTEENGYKLDLGNYVRHRAGIGFDGERCVSWWMEDYGSRDKRGFVPVYAFMRY